MFFCIGDDESGERSGKMNDVFMVVREAIEVGVNNVTGLDNILPSVLSILRRQDNE